jgi:hypothetical protein
MLDFYLADEGRVPEVPDESQFVGNLSMEDCHWLKKFGFVQDEVFSFFDSSWISPADVQTALGVLGGRQDESQQSPGFSSSAIERLNKILRSAVERGSGLVTFCD